MTIKKHSAFKSKDLSQQPIRERGTDEYLEVRWINFGKDYDIHYKRFKRMGALLEWVENNKALCVSVGLAIYKKEKEG